MYGEGKISLECWYCGHKWSEHRRWGGARYQCPKCGDKQIIEHKGEYKINTYVGAPPFPKTDGDDEGGWNR